MTALDGVPAALQAGRAPRLSALLERIMLDESRHFFFYYRQAEERLLPPGGGEGQRA